MNITLVHHVAKNIDAEPSDYASPTKPWGPWSLQFLDLSPSGKDWYVSADDCMPFVKVYDYKNKYYTDDERLYQKNCLRLMTAAPDLLDFAQVVLEENISHAINEFAKKVIEKATNGELNGF
jgi:hypothetical protein